MSDGEGGSRSLPETPVPIAMVVFDLDDTLIDTFGVLVPAAHRAASEAMARALDEIDGAPDADAIQAVRERLLAEDPRDLDARVAAALELPTPEATQAAARAGSNAWHRPRIPAECKLDLKGVRSLLRRLARDYKLVLLTQGDPATQAAKLRKAKLEDSFKQAVYVPVEGSKFTALGKLMERNEIRGQQVVVIGDRPDREIEAANRLGCWTIRVQRGEFAELEPASEAERAHATVSETEAVQPLLLSHFVPPARVR